MTEDRDNLATFTDWVMKFAEVNNLVAEFEKQIHCREYVVGLVHPTTAHGHSMGVIRMTFEQLDSDQWTQRERVRSMSRGILGTEVTS